MSLTILLFLCPKAFPGEAKKQENLVKNMVLAIFYLKMLNALAKIAVFGFVAFDFDECP